MPPNLAPKTVNVAKFELFNHSAKTTTKGNSVVVRTDYVIQNIFGYLLGQEFGIPEIASICAKENDVLTSVKSVVDEFQASYSSSIAELSASLEVTEETVESVFLGVSNELFCEGVTWSRLATLFVFASELVLQCRSKGFPVSIGSEVLNYLMQFVRSDIEKWVQDHGGWEGFIEFSNGKRDVIKNSDHVSGWAKAALVGTVKMFGTLAHLATYTDPVMSFPMNRTSNVKDTATD